MKAVVGVVGAGIVAMALMAGPAEARCAWNGAAWQCWNTHGKEVRRDQHRLQQKRAEVRHDRQKLRRLQAKLQRDMHSGSSRDVNRTTQKLRRAHRELREDRADLRDVRRDLHQDRRWGY